MSEPSVPTVRWNSGPFTFRHSLLYRLGFDFCEEYELEERWPEVERQVQEAQGPPPSWAADRPGAGIAGTWRLKRRRLTLWGIPIWFWKGERR